MLALVLLYVHNGPVGFFPHSQFWALIAFLISCLSLPSPSLYSILSSPPPPSLLNLMHAYKGVLVCPLWAGFSPGVRPPVQQLGWDFWCDITAFWMFFVMEWMSLKRPGSGTNAIFSLISLCQMFFPVTSNAPHTFGGLMLFFMPVTQSTSTWWHSLQLFWCCHSGGDHIHEHSITTYPGTCPPMTT